MEKTADQRPHIIGVISDTHGLLRREAVQALKGVERILHVGDVGAPDILEALSAIAPVTAIRGNVDTQSWADKLPETEAVDLGGVMVYMVHDINDLDLDPQTAGFAAVLSGHSHRPEIETRKGVLYLNPGSAGPRRFTLPVTVAKLRLENDTLDAEIIPLEVD